MISKCARHGCNHSFRHPRDVMQQYCSKYCRFITGGQSNKRKIAKLNRLEKTWNDAAIISEKLEKEMRTKNKNA